MAIPDGMFSDTTRIIQSSARFDIEEMKIAYAIAKSTDFLEWSNATRGILFLNGSGKITAARESSTSALFASLVIGTIDDPTVTVLHFFCGLHCNFGGVVSGPKGLMRSLIAQLSVKQNFDLNFIDDQLKREEVRDHDIHRLCETFSAMAFQLPADHEVCCLIEGISWLENTKLARRSYCNDSLSVLSECGSSLSGSFQASGLVSSKKLDVDERGEAVWRGCERG